MRLTGLGVSLLSLSAITCSGRSFVLLAEGQEPASGGAAAATDATQPIPKDGAGGNGGGAGHAATDGGSDAGGQAGAGGSEPEPPDEEDPEPELTACGLPRTPNVALRVAELCVPGASFSMGSEEPVPSSGFNVHAPVHEVQLSSYWLDSYEVSVGRYRVCVDAGECTAPRSSGVDGCSYSLAPAASEALPVTCVTWDQAAEFCSWDEQRRLPTEAEWEFAARGGEGRRYAWGDTFDCGLAVVGALAACPQHSPLLPAEAGSIRLGQTPEGSFDLTGNTAEWVNDWVGSYSATPQVDPQGPATAGAKVYRGGGWRDTPGFVLTYLRRSATRTTAGTLGFRCARSAETTL